MKERDIKIDGKIFEYASDSSCAEIGFNKRANWFYIILNGVCVHTSYTFRPALKKITALIEKYSLVAMVDYE